MSAEFVRARQRGLTLIELIMFIVIVSVGIVGILSVMNVTTRASADPLIDKQAVAIAESLLEEIQLQPFTFCDPELDPAAATATGTGDCAVAVQGIAPNAGQTRYGDASGNNRFNNVGDYGGFVMNGILELNGTATGGLERYNAVVAITQETQGGVTQASGDALRIDVTVTMPNGQQVVLTGYRFRYAPRAVP